MNEAEARAEFGRGAHTSTPKVGFLLVRGQRIPRERLSFPCEFRLDVVGVRMYADGTRKNKGKRSGG